MTPTPEEVRELIERLRNSATALRGRLSVADATIGPLDIGAIMEREEAAADALEALTRGTKEKTGDEDDAWAASLLSSEGKTAEQWARDLMELCGWDEAQERSSGEVVFLANILRDYLVLTRGTVDVWIGKGRTGWEFAYDDGTFTPGPHSRRARLQILDEPSE